MLPASGRPQEAEQFYRKVLEFKPEGPEAQNDLAWVLVACPTPNSDPSRALELAKKAVELNRGREKGPRG